MSVAAVVVSVVVVAVEVEAAVPIVAPKTIFKTPLSSTTPSSVNVELVPSESGAKYITVLLLIASTTTC